jgi:hypothetical protein
MKKIDKNYGGYFLLGWMFLLTSCINSDEFDPNRIAEVNWNPAYSVPVLYGSLSIKDILNDRDSAALSVYPDGLYFLDYEDKLESRDITSLIEVPIFSLNRSYTKTSPVSVAANDVEVLYERTEELTLNMSPEEFTEMVASAGDLLYSASTNIQAEIKMTFSSPAIELNGDSLVFTLDFEGNNVIQFSNGIKNLAGYQFDFATLSPAYNKLPINVKVEVFGGNSGVLIPITHYVDFNLSFENIDYTLIGGYFGQQSVSIPSDEIDISRLGQTLEGADISFESFNLRFEIKNEYGIPVRVTLNQFEARKEPGESLAINTSPPSPFVVDAADLIGAAITTIDVTNGSAIFNFTPEKLFYDASVLINPAGRSENFVTDTSKLDLNLITEIPMWGSASNITLEDTVEFSLGDVEQVDVQKALLKIKIVNQFPIDANVQMFFTDENFNVTDSLFVGDQKNLIRSAEIDANGELVAGGEGIYDDIIEMDKTRFENLLKTKNIIIIARLQTTRDADNGTPPHVKIKESYKLDVDMGVQTEFDLTLNLN